MFELSKDELEKIGARITTEEIKQQPDLWEEVVEILEEKKMN